MDDLDDEDEGDESEEMAEDDMEVGEGADLTLVTTSMGWCCLLLTSLLLKTKECWFKRPFETVVISPFSNYLVKNLCYLNLAFLQMYKLENQSCSVLNFLGC